MSIEELSARLEKVERANRRMRAAGLAAVILAAAGVAMGQAAPEGETLRVRKIILVDHAGRERGELSPTHLRFLGAEGTRELRLGFSTVDPGSVEAVGLQVSDTRGGDKPGTVVSDTLVSLGVYPHLDHGLTDAMGVTTLVPRKGSGRPILELMTPRTGGQRTRIELDSRTAALRTPDGNRELVPGGASLVLSGSNGAAAPVVTLLHNHEPVAVLPK